MNCRVTERFFEVMNLLQSEIKESRDYGTGQPLYHAEVAFLDAIHKHPGAKVSRISEMLGITKGAVTQMAAKLSGKQLIEIYLQPGNRKEKFYRLTPEGEAARVGHERYHEAANQRICEYFRSLDDEQTQTVFDFLSHLKECVPFCEFTCQCSHEDIDEKETEYAGNSEFACTVGNG